MNAPLQALQPLPLFTNAWADVLRLRQQQVDGFGHGPEADDATGPRELFRKAAGDIAMVQSMLHGDPRKLTAQEQTILRRRAVRALALGFAGLDTLDRALSNGSHDA